MNLHNDKESFRELISATSVELGIPANIIEKDYYVTIALWELSSHINGMVFKGGTSLTKCYQILDRFSEDIDISYDASEGPPSESKKRRLKKSIITSMNHLNFPITNLSETHSRRNYNCYHASYPSIYTPISELKSELIIETYIAMLPFPTTVCMADNYIYRFLLQTDQLQLAERFNLMPFKIKTQSIERTFIDKVFALCDYYLSGKVSRHSRHLYDIHQIMKNIVIPPSLLNLIQEVRKVRAPLPVCPSAAEHVNVNKVLTEIIDKEIYREDYKNITENLLFSPLPYDIAIKSLQHLVDKKYFE